MRTENNRVISSFSLIDSNFCSSSYKIPLLSLNIAAPLLWHGRSLLLHSLGNSSIDHNCMNHTLVSHGHLSLQRTYACDAVAPLTPTLGSPVAENVQPPHLLKNSWSEASGFRLHSLLHHTGATWSWCWSRMISEEAPCWLLHTHSINVLLKFPLLSCCFWTICTTCHAQREALKKYTGDTWAVGPDPTFLISTHGFFEAVPKKHRSPIFAISAGIYSFLTSGALLKSLLGSNISPFLRFPLVLCLTETQQSLHQRPGCLWHQPNVRSSTLNETPCALHAPHKLHWLCRRNDCSLLPTCVQPLRFRLHKC